MERHENTRKGAGDERCQVFTRNSAVSSEQIPLEVFTGKYVDWEYIGNRMCHKFLLENGSILYATDHGGRGSLPKTGNMVKIKIYEKWNDTAIKWKVESVD